MPGRMTNAEARIVDPLLTTAVRGYSQPDLIYSSLFPRVTVTARGGKRIEFDRNEFVQRNTRRAPGADAKQVEFGHQGQPYALDPHSLDGKVPYETAEEAARANIQLELRTAQLTFGILELELERRAAALATDASLYAAGNKITLSGTSQWSHASSTPAKAVETGKEAVRAKIGKYPNVMAMGASVASALRNNADVIERVKYSQRGTPNMDDMRAYFDMPNIAVGKAVSAATADATSFTDIWGDFVVLAYVAVGSVTNSEPSFAYTYELNGHPRVYSRYWNDSNRSWMIPVDWERELEIVGAEGGYLFSDVLA